VSGETASGYTLYKEQKPAATLATAAKILTVPAWGNISAAYSSSSRWVRS
jgi:hypothetical protein